MPPSSAPRPGLASFLGREPDPSDKATAPLEGTSGFLVRSAQRSPGRAGGDSWLRSWQEWLGAGAGMTLQREGLTALRSLGGLVRNPLPRPLSTHPSLPHNCEGWGTPQEAWELKSSQEEGGSTSPPHPPPGKVD